MNILKNIAFGFSLAIGLVSCGEDFFESTVEIDIPEHEPGLAVSAILTKQDTANSVYISKSLGILSPDQYEVISDATVLLDADHNNPVSFIYDANEEEYYANQMAGFLEAGPEYSMIVEHPVYGRAVAKGTLPNAAKILSLTYEPNGTIDEDGFEADEITVEIEDPAGEANYYYFQAIKRIRFFNGIDTSYITEPLYGLASRDPLVQRGYNSGDYEGMPMISDNTFQGRSYTLRLFTYDEVNPGDEIIFQCFSVNKDRFDYLASLQAYYINQDNPFSEPVNVISNFEGGVGIFALQNLTEMVVKL
ncbi:MAG: DUF4249 domain-containing protein [Saprospiraceae bacterium]